MDNNEFAETAAPNQLCFHQKECECNVRTISRNRTSVNNHSLILNTFSKEQLFSQVWLSQVWLSQVWLFLKFTIVLVKLFSCSRQCQLPGDSVWSQREGLIERWTGNLHIVLLNKQVGFACIPAVLFLLLQHVNTIHHLKCYRIS